MKPWYKSLTFWGLVLTLLGLATAGIGRGTPLLDIFGDPTAQDIVGQLMLMLGMGGAVLGRTRAQGPIQFKKPKPATEKPFIAEAKNPGPPDDWRPDPPSPSPTPIVRKTYKRPVYETEEPSGKPSLVPEGFHIIQHVPASGSVIKCRMCEECGKTVVEDVT